MIKGLYLSEPLNERKISQIVDLGVNMISLPWKHHEPELVNRLRSKDIMVFAEVSLFVGKELWEKYPDSRPIDRNGQPIEALGWYYGVCPNHPTVRKEKLHIIDKVAQTGDIDGIWLDFIRYPCRWEQVRTSQITEYCFCKNCLEKFKNDLGGLPEGENWTVWKCDQITGFVREARKRIDQTGQLIQLGIFALPWHDNTYGGAINTIVCQDFQAMSDFADLFGVMAYHKLTEQPVSWIGEIVQKLHRTTGKSVVPLIQSMDEPKIILKDEFKHSVITARKPPSAGIIVFHFEDLLSNESKIRSFKQFGETHTNIPL